jgi:hypothetical protein
MHDHNDLSSFFVSEFNMPTTSNSHVADLKQKLADAYTTQNHLNYSTTAFCPTQLTALGCSMRIFKWFMSA